MADLKELIKKRGSIKGRLTMFVNYVNGLKSVLSSVQTTELKLRIAKAELLFSQYDEIQSCIETAVEDDNDMPEQYKERREFENQFYAIVAQAQEVVDVNRTINNDDDDASSCHSQASGRAETGTAVKHRRVSSSRGVKLPTIQVPKFSGRYTDWLEFRDTFVSLIHENRTITEIQKFHYLRASLDGGAAQVIRSLEFSSNNYTVAWELLCDRYNNDKLLIQNHVQALFLMDPIKRESAQLIRSIIDTFSKNLRSLEILGEPTKSWDTLIIYLINSKLDPKTSREWEEKKCSLNKISLDDFMSFLKGRADLLESINMNNKPERHRIYQTENVKGLTTTAVNSGHYNSCPLCSKEHRIYNCDTFLGQPINQRKDSVQKLKLCLNCLRFGHRARVCRSGKCTKCSGNHNTLLHEDTRKTSHEVATIDGSSTALSAQMAERVLLSTAVIYIRDKFNRRHEARAVLDSGSQASFMTEVLLHKLELKHTEVFTSVIGINNAVSQVTKRCQTFIESRLNEFKAEISFLVLNSIASFCKESVPISPLQINTHVQLADPQYYNPSNIDLLLGADIFWELLDQGQIRLGANCPILQLTKLGYIISGPTSGLKHTHSKTNSNIVACNVSRNDISDVQDQLSKFWSLEETPNINKPIYSKEERLCEDNFVQNFERMTDGRFSVAIPLKSPETRLGNSHDRARQCFLSMERRLQREPKLKQMYREFMREYRDLGHMSVIAHPYTSDISYYLPHHGVLRESSTTTKLRVVFNASAPTTTGVSCNDLQMVGPTIQSDLFSILIRFRHYTYVVSGDIEKMYRQVQVHKTHRYLQRILWREDPSEELAVFELNTVTYGTASAPFLAVRCLKQLALECKDPQIAQIISEDFYVDDLVTGQQSAAALRAVRDGVCKVLSSGCFNLRKIRSNIKDFFASETDPSTSLNLGQQTSANTLGLGWISPTDQLYFSQRPTTVHNNPTKRSILSAIGQIFDPLGLLSVFVIQAKILLQKLWLLKVSWDDHLPSKIVQTWTQFVSDLSYLDLLHIPRCVTCSEPTRIELHVFCDSSQDAYGACVYVKSWTSSEQTQTHLLCAKSKVAPIKSVTIPRLELCGALTAAKLTKKVMDAFRLPICRCIFWTDSTIVMGWLHTNPNKLKPFVKNRVSETQELTQNHEWRHVPTHQNPADLLTRGVNMSEINELKLWWTGPPFLQEDEKDWPKLNSNQDVEPLPELIVHLTSIETPIEFSRFSKLSKLNRTFTYVLRFIHNSKPSNSKARLLGSLSASEMDKAFKALLRIAQMQSFEEYELLINGKTLPEKNRLTRLSPFIDSGLIRVGGRLQNSGFEFDIKHPILISCTHPITNLIFLDEHLRLFHAAPQLLLSSIRQRFWPLGGRNMARSIVHRCVRCSRMRAKTISPIMGQLPQERLDPGYPFQTTGVDYAGPILSADRRGRGCRLIKVYIAIFVCFTTKAVHLELVSDLTREAYIAALRRFIARRSKPSCMFSDNGTQFVGAMNEITQFLKRNSAIFIETMANDGIDFKFIPAYAPHFGGLWEAGVKSVKYHLVRILGNSNLTFEELYTVLVQIESILNSRPLAPISTDPNDLTPLTPGHFLVGRPLTALPSPNFENVNPLSLRRWERVEQLRQHFWTRWHKEYVTELQLKTKWRTSKGYLEKGTMVLVKEDTLPPMKWCLGRVEEVHMGKDSVIRVADIRTSKGVVRRAVHKLCPLPIMNEGESTKSS